MHRPDPAQSKIVHLGTFTAELKQRAERRTIASDRRDNPFDPLPGIAALTSGPVDHPWWVDLIGCAALAAFIFAVALWIGAV